MVFAIPKYTAVNIFWYGGPAEVRTRNLPGKSRELYPVELRTHILLFSPSLLEGTGFRFMVRLLKKMVGVKNFEILTSRV